MADKQNEGLSQAVVTSLNCAMNVSMPVAIGNSSTTTNKDVKNKMTLSDLLVPGSSIRKSESFSDDSLSPTSPTSPSKRWSPLLRNKKKVRVRPSDNAIKSAGNSPEQIDKSTVSVARSVPHLSLNTTSVSSLPGQKTSQVVVVPEILVSPDDNEDGGIINRKTSQSSHLSVASSSGAHSIGSAATPSGDEDGTSDQESLLSPLSHQSSYTGSSREDVHMDDDTLSSSPPGTDGETDDFIEADIENPSNPVPNELTIPSNTTVNVTKKKKKWAVLRKAVTWSPFVQVYRKKYPWVQLAGHQGNFSPGEENGTIIKKSSCDEAKALSLLMNDALRPFVPEYRRDFVKNSELYIEMADLLRDFDNPSVMDVKMGTRTYLEDELVKARVKEVLRPDMYDKMIGVDPSEPTEAEHQAKAITKPRYMIWRETLSSTATLGFRIEGVKLANNKPLHEEFKTVRTREEVSRHLKKFVKKSEIRRKLLDELMNIRIALEKSEFFMHHEVIGSSLLFVYDSHNQARVSIIDFGKTIPLPDGMTTNHRTPWQEGNHEDGYLFGLDNLISIWEAL